MMNRSWSSMQRQHGLDKLQGHGDRLIVQSFAGRQPFGHLLQLRGEFPARHGPVFLELLQFLGHRLGHGRQSLQVRGEVVVDLVGQFLLRQLAHGGGGVAHLLPQLSQLLAKILGEFFIAVELRKPSRTLSTFAASPSIRRRAA